MVQPENIHSGHSNSHLAARSERDHCAHDYLHRLLAPIGASCRWQKGFLLSARLSLSLRCWKMPQGSSTASLTSRTRIWRTLVSSRSSICGLTRSHDLVISLAVQYYLRVGDAPLQFSRADDLPMYPDGRAVSGAAMMREIDRIPNLEHRSWWHSELGQHLSRHCWCRANRAASLGELSEVEVCRLRGWDWNTHQRRVELASAAAAAWLNRKQFQSGVPGFP
jgi:hypothetical protein